MINSTEQTLYRLDNLNTEQQRINYQMSTGKNLQYGSDDSSAYTREVFINDKIKMYDGIQKQIEKTNAQNDGSDSALAEAKDLVSYVKAEVIKALNATTDDTAKEAIATNLEGVKQNLLTLANEQIEGEYLFSGTDSSVKPFEINDTTGKVTYVGDDELRKVVVEDGSYRDRGITGIEGFFTTSQVATTGETLSFSVNDIMYDEDGSLWKRHESVDEGEVLTITTSHALVDGNGNDTWTLNTSVPQLEDSSGNVISSVSNIGGGLYEVTVPDSINGLAYNQLRKYDNDGNIVGGIAMNISGTYPDDLSVTVRSDLDSLELKTNIFNTLDSIINALTKVDANGNTVTDDVAQDALSSGLTNISNAYDSMNLGHAKLGGRNKVFEISYERIQSKVAQFNLLSVEVSSADLTKVAVEAKALELTYTALYSTINRMNELSLVNFLR